MISLNIRKIIPTFIKIRPVYLIKTNLSILLMLLFIYYPAAAEVKILTSIKPIQLIAAAILDGLGSPDVLLPKWSSPHYYSLRPSDIKMLKNVNVFYWIGPDLEKFLEKIIKTSKVNNVAIQNLKGIYLRRTNDEELFSDNKHTNNTIDTHLWLLISNALLIAEKMTKDLIELDPSNAFRYNWNMKEFRKRLNYLDKKLTKQLSGVDIDNKPYFLYHDAFNYFEEYYNLNHKDIFYFSENIKPGVKHIEAIRSKLKDVGKSCIFIEPLTKNNIIDIISDGGSVYLEELDPLGILVEVNAFGYENLLKNIANNIVHCLKKV